MRYFWFILIFGVCSSTVFSQRHIAYFAVTHHIITNDAGNAPMQDEATIHLIMDLLNEKFLPAGIQFFFSCRAIDTIKSTEKYNFVINANSRKYLTDTAAEPNTINIYYANTITSGTTPILGQSVFPWNNTEDYIIVMRTNSPIYNTNSLKRLWVVLHEAAHMFGLPHSFDQFDDYYRAEHPDAQPVLGPRNMDCRIVGDSICDTPADVNANKDEGGVEYFEVYPDSNGCLQCSLTVSTPYNFNRSGWPWYWNHHLPNGWNYRFDVKNIMNYTSFICWEYFTPGQYARMRRNAVKDPFSTFTAYEKLTSKIGNPVVISLSSIGQSSSQSSWYTFTVNCADCDCQPDTIYYKNAEGVEDCLQDTMKYRIHFPRDMPEFFLAKWFINGRRVSPGTEGGFPNDYFFNLSAHEKIWKNPNYTDEYITVEAVLEDGTKYVFKFRVSDHSIVATKFLPHISGLWKNFDYDITDSNTVSIEVDLSKRFILPLLDLEGCDLDIKIDSAVSWTLDTASNSIVFAPTEECDLTAQLRYQCECVGVLNINIKNTNPACDEDEEEPEEPENPCDSIRLEHLVLPVAATHLESFQAFCNYVFHITSINASPYNITNIEVLNMLGDSIGIEMVFDIEDSTGNIKFEYVSPSMPPHWPSKRELYDTVTFPLSAEICVYLEGINEPCCSTIEIFLHFTSIFSGIVSEGGIVPNPVDVGNATIRYTLEYLPTEPLKITIVDQQGIQRILVYDDIPTSLVNSNPVNVSMLTPGIYFVVFEIDDQTLSLPFTMSFIKQ